MSGPPNPKVSAGFVTTKPRKRVNRESAKRKAMRAERAEVCRVVRERDGDCVARQLVPEVECGGPLDVNEKNYGAYKMLAYLNPERCNLLCRVHHGWCHSHDKRAVELDLLRRRDMDRPWTPEDDT